MQHLFENDQVTTNDDVQCECNKCLNHDDLQPPHNEGMSVNGSQHRDGQQAVTSMNCQSGKNSRHKKSHQTDNFKARNYFINQENDISCSRLLCIAARTFRTQDVLNTCVKMKIYMQE